LALEKTAVKLRLLVILGIGLLCGGGWAQAGPSGQSGVGSGIPDEVKFKKGYVNSPGRPADFHSVMLWGIAIADTRVRGYESAVVQVADLRLSCRVDGKDILLIEDVGRLRGGLYQRIPWFKGNQPEAMPTMIDKAAEIVSLPVGTRADRIWHFWSASPRPALPTGKLGGCTAAARVRISSGALLQMGMDYWRDTTVPFEGGGNNHEAGASDWYLPSGEWQEAEFSDIPGLQQ
jgi:hypothetical protein